MSAPRPNAAYPHPWFQPVRYDLDAYRSFAGSLDASLSVLVANHKPRRVSDGTRSPLFTIQRDDMVDSQPETPPEQSSC